MLINAFLLGLSTGIFCFSYCAPVYLPQVIATNDKHRGWSVFLKFNGGRLMAYIIFGAVFGWLGAQTHVMFLHTYAKWVIILLAIALILYGLGLSLPRIKCSGWARKARFPLLSGFLLGINICPPFLLAVTQNFQIGGALNGALFFFLFFLGTTVYLIPVTFLGCFAKIKWIRQAGRVAAVAVGVIMIAQVVL